MQFDEHFSVRRDLKFVIVQSGEHVSVQRDLKFVMVQFGEHFSVQRDLKFVIVPVILCGWLGLKHQLTN